MDYIEKIPEVVREAFKSGFDLGLFQATRGYDGENPKEEYNHLLKYFWEEYLSRTLREFRSASL